MINIPTHSYQPFTWTHEYLFQLLTKSHHHLVRSTNLIKAFEYIDRADFVPANQQADAYMDKLIELPYGSILDKPTVIAEMLQLTKPAPGGTFLDIGSGSGYVAALLGVAGGEGSKVYSLERNQFLAEIARINIKKYPFLNNVEIVFCDGSLGYPEKGQYDVIHVSASYDEIPQPLLDQLKVGGYLCIPRTNRDLSVFHRTGAKDFQESTHKAFFFDKIQDGIE